MPEVSDTFTIWTKGVAINVSDVSQETYWCYQNQYFYYCSSSLQFLLFHFHELGESIEMRYKNFEISILTLELEELFNLAFAKDAMLTK